MSQEFSFKLSFEDLDLDLLGDPNMDRTSDLFASKVSDFFAKQFHGFGGSARVIVQDTDREIEVRWTKQATWKDPKGKILDLLNRGELATALPMIWTLVKQDPSDADNLYHLGVVYSELRQYSKASEILERLIQIAPQHVYGLTALGVAEIGSGNLKIGEEWLSKAVRIQPKNRWALRNLGACLMKQGRFEEASKVLRRCLGEAPKDVNVIVGLAESLEAMGQVDEVDDLYQSAIKIGGPDDVIDIAKDRRTKIAEAGLRASGKLRPDAMHYIQVALDRFATMTPQEIQNCGQEIALLGRFGFDINNPSKRYTLKALSGEFTGLQLVSIMYAAYQQFSPGQDVGIDLSKEYEAAVKQTRG